MPTRSDRGAANRFLRIGVTGGIGSGKSTVCDYFSGLGRTVFRADDIARTLMEEDSALRSRLTAAFGKESYDAGGRLNRRYLAGLAFKSISATSRLNQIVHPVVIREIAHRIARLTDHEKSPYVVVEAALIFESRMDTDLDYVLVVDAPEEERIKRVIARDGMSADEVRRRARAQMTGSQRLGKADFVIANIGGLESLAADVRFFDQLFSRITQEAGS